MRILRWQCQATAPCRCEDTSTPENRRAVGVGVLACTARANAVEHKRMPAAEAQLTSPPSRCSDFKRCSSRFMCSGADAECCSVLRMQQQTFGNSRTLCPVPSTALLPAERRQNAPLEHGTAKQMLDGAPAHTWGLAKQCTSGDSTRLTAAHQPHASDGGHLASACGLPGASGDGGCEDACGSGWPRPRPPATASAARSAACSRSSWLRRAPSLPPCASPLPPAAARAGLALSRPFAAASSRSAARRPRYMSCLAWTLECQHRAMRTRHPPSACLSC